MELERKIEWQPAYDKTKEGYGVHGMTMRWILKGSLGAVQFVLYTNWQLKNVQERLDERIHPRFPHLHCHPLPADLGYHSYKPLYDTHRPMDRCDILGVPCYYDGSALNAEPVYWKFVEHGEEAVWKHLEEFYAETFARLPVEA